MKPDHEAAKKRAEAECRSPTFPGQSTHNLAACYLDAMAQLKAVRIALGGYPDSDLASLAMTLNARLDKATELLRLLDHVEIYTCGRVDVAALRASIRAFIDERK